MVVDAKCYVKQLQRHLSVQVMYAYPTYTPYPIGRSLFFLCILFSISDESSSPSFALQMESTGSSTYRGVGWFALMMMSDELECPSPRGGTGSTVWCVASALALVGWVGCCFELGRTVGRSAPYPR